jgi:hypothetical protein
MSISEIRRHRRPLSWTPLKRGCSHSTITVLLLILLHEFKLVDAQYFSATTRSLQGTPVPSPLVMAATPTLASAPTTPIPTRTPSLRPSTTPPSPAPTLVPTASPTTINSAKQRFSQSFVVHNNTFFTDNQDLSFGNLLKGYTAIFALSNESSLVTTDALVLTQKFTFAVNNSLTVIESAIDYVMEYRSLTVNVTGYPDLFLAYVNNHLGKMTTDVQSLGLTITRAMQTQVVQVETVFPTALRTSSPAISPTSQPTTLTFPPTRSPYNPAAVQSKSLPVPLIATVTVLGGIFVLVCCVLFYRHTQKGNRRRASLQRNRKRYEAKSLSAASDERTTAAAAAAAAKLQSAIGPSLSNDGSLVSHGKSDEGLDSLGSYSLDGTRNEHDEFDRYKDQNLEELRSHVEGNLSGFEGIMSAAVTKALMGDEDAQPDENELLWGCDGNPSGTEVEASALVEVSDWLKRNDSSPVDQRRAFMQEMLNKMVASVRCGVLEADDASRTIHEAAALLGLQLANDLPMTTVVISGMRKTVEASEVVEALREFGDIDNAAVASGKRGFGIVRFRHPKSVERAMQRYRNAEIVVQDVAVQMKVLMPSGEVLSRA